MSNFLSNTKKQVVGISLTPGLGLEAVILDKTGNAVQNYGRKKVEYNFSTREIQDYVQFKTALSELVDEMKIPPKTSAYLILPNIHFNFIEIPPIVVDEQIKTMILSEAEEFYIFKKDEPVSGWAEVAVSGTSQRRLAYSSFQKTAIDQIKDIFADVGLQLAGIENNYSATLRGLYRLGFIDDVIASDAPWTMMIIGTNSYGLMHLEGKNLMDYNEVPLAIKSFSAEEAYQAIVSSASQMLSNFESSKLYIISQTDDICADVLKRQMQFDRDIVAIDTNAKYSKKPLLDVISTTTQDYNDVNALTLSAIAATITKSDFGLTLNILADDPASSMGVYFTKNIGGAEVDVTSELVMKLSLMITVVVAGILFGLYYAATLYKGDLEAKKSNFDQEIANTQTLIDAESKVEVKEEEVDMTSIIDDVAKTNVSSISFYDSISTDIPKNIWLTRYYNKDGNSIAVKGIAQSIVDIYEYYKNLRVVSPQSNIRLNELKVVTQNMQSEDSKYLAGLAIDRETDRLYSFEISNTNIPVQRTENNSQSGDNKFDESVIIPAGGMVEQMAQQMIPTN